MENKHIQILMRSILTTIDRELAQGNTPIIIARCRASMPNTSTVNPCVTLALNRLHAEVTHTPPTTFYLIPKQILTEARARKLKEEFTILLNSSYVLCDECQHTSPEPYCQLCGTCNKTVCNLCIANHEYMEDKAVQRNNPKGNYNM